ncbi:MAG TPA: oligosaccharide flippase family protein [Solirubrobacteraceae bacterium]|nr:oligosaccharide flippase family protein [Solirubrobacteraceae bacterium]
MSADDATAQPHPVGRGRRKLYRDIASTLGTRMLLLPLGLASSVMVTRALEPAGKGMYTTVLTFATLATAVGSLGFGRAATYYIARRERDPDDVRAATFALSLGNGLLLTAVMAVLAVTLLPSAFEGIPDEVFLAAAPIGVLTLLRLAYEGFLRGEQRNQAVNALTLIASAAFVVPLAVWLLVDDLSPSAAVALKTTALAVTVGAAAYLLGRRRLGLARRVDRRTARLILGFGIPYAITVLTQHLSYRVDILFIQVLKGNADVGWYSVTTTLAELLWYLPMAVGFVVFPRVAAGRAARDDATEVAALCRWTILATAAAAVVLGVVASPLIEVMFGEDFLPAASATRLILFGIVTNVWFQIFSGYLAGAGRLRPILAGTGAGVALNVVLNLLLVPELGIDGAAISSSISYTVGAIVVLVAFLRHSGLPVRAAVLPTAAEARSRWRTLAGIMRRRSR